VAAISLFDVHSLKLPLCSCLPNFRLFCDAVSISEFVYNLTRSGAMIVNVSHQLWPVIAHRSMLYEEVLTETTIMLVSISF